MQDRSDPSVKQSACCGGVRADVPIHAPPRILCKLSAFCQLDIEPQPALIAGTRSPFGFHCPDFKRGHLYLHIFGMQWDEDIQLFTQLPAVVVV